ncbi:MAG: hypothetical protein RIB93_01570 [Coleofasciculus sp. D1-CHI-01]|uniref:hypothetical protein n=1 Tax=unclassified Coleofasciculus TaxID=2692782 RepID=UPI0032F3E146
MVDSKKQYNFHGDVGSVESHGHIISSGKSNTINSGAGEVKGDYKNLQHFNNYAPEQKQTLAQAAAEIQQLLEQLKQTYPNATETERQSALVVTLQQEIKHNPTFRTRLRNALKEGGIEALKVLFAPIGIPIEMVRGWVEAEADSSAETAKKGYSVDD